jgi:hypothetical protein
LYGAVFADVSMVTYIGGSGDDEIVSSGFASDGSIIIGGLSTSESVTGADEVRLGEGSGFVAKLDAGGSSVEWVTRLPEVKEIVVDAGDAVHVLLDRSVAVIKPDGSGYLRQGDDLGSGTVDMDIAPDGSMAVLTGGKVHFLEPGGTERWNKDVGRSHLLCVAIDPVSKNIWVGGDKNTNTGHEPWRSPFLFEYEASSGSRLTQLWDWPGPAVRADGKQLQADSFIRFLKFSPDGRLWIGAGSDGGNSVLRKEPGDLDQDQDALSGTCFSGPCFGYKGAKKTGMFGRMKSPATDLEYASWVIPYVGMDPGSHLDPPCGCKGNNFNGSGVNPGSFAVSAILPTESGVIVLGNPWGNGPSTEDGWYYNTIYPGGGIGWMGVFSEDLTGITEASMIPGTKNAHGGYRNGLVCIVGKTVDRSDFTPDPAEQDWHVALPVTDGAVQNEYGGGKTDGYLLLACMDADGECDASTGIHDRTCRAGVHKQVAAPRVVEKGIVCADGLQKSRYRLLTVSGAVIQHGVIPSHCRIDCEFNQATEMLILNIGGEQGEHTWKIVRYR